MRVIVTVTEGPAKELHAELACIPARQRAERLRHLAALGLALLGNAELVLKGGPSTEGNLTPEGRPPLTSDAAQRQDKLKSRLADGLGAELPG